MQTTISPRWSVGTASLRRRKKLFLHPSARSRSTGTDAIQCDAPMSRDFSQLPRHPIHDSLPWRSTPVKPGNSKITAHFIHKDKVPTVKGFRQARKLPPFFFISLTVPGVFFFVADPVPGAHGRGLANSPSRPLVVSRPSVIPPVSHLVVRRLPHVTTPTQGIVSNLGGLPPCTR